MMQGNMNAEAQRQVAPHMRRFSPLVLVGTFLGSVGSAFFAGHLYRSLLLHKPLGYFAKEDCSFSNSCTPFPILYDGKQISSASSYSKNQFRPEILAPIDSLPATLLTGVDDGADFDASLLKEGENNDEGLDGHSNPRRHLLVDIEDVESHFLESKPLLSKALLHLVSLVDMSILSYHCELLVPSGIKCIGLSSGSHISFQTWPDAGTLSLDIFAANPKPLRFVLNSVKATFGVPRDEDVRVRWAYKNRGFPFDKEDSNPEEVWMEHFILGRMSFEMKEVLVSTETDFQTVEIFKVIDPITRSRGSYHVSITEPNSYERQHDELFQPDRVLYLDEVMQSGLRGDAAYHEALVHPGMFAHPNPKRVAIIGGGEGATLREVLKHATVEHVSMIEIDEQMVSVSAKYLPEWSDCGDIVGSRMSCFDDPRAETYFEDAIAWFIDRYLDSDNVDKANEYDVVIMDALDPHSAVGFSDMLYNNSDFVRAISNALGKDGVFIAQVGEDFNIDDPPTEISIEKIHEAIFMQHLQNHGFHAIKDYTEAHGGFGGVWRFLVAFKDETNRKWYSNAAEVEIAIRKRSLPSVSRPNLFRYFDGATMMSYQYPNRISQIIYCRSNPDDDLCVKHEARVGGILAELEVSSSGESNDYDQQHNRDHEQSEMIDVFPRSMELIRTLASFDQCSRNWNGFDQLGVIPKASITRVQELNKTEAMACDSSVYPHIYCPSRERHLHFALLVD